MNENVISKKELDCINNFINLNKNLFWENIHSPHRKLLYFKELNSKGGIKVPKLFSIVKTRILSKENITKNDINDSPYGDYIGYIENEGKVHPHKDPTINEYDHIRFNLFISVPEEGGFPIYNGETISVKVGDYVRCNSSKYIHECQPVIGNVPRIVVSYGIFLKKELINIEYL